MTANFDERIQRLEQASIDTNAAITRLSGNVSDLRIDLNESIIRLTNIAERVILQTDQRMSIVEQQQMEIRQQQTEILQQILGTQTEIRRLWEYLTNQNGNGQG
jgi:hypothetical protein